VPKFYGETAGADFAETRAGTCKKCKGALLVGLLRNAKGTLRWQNFNAKPRESDGLRYYTRHACPR
jgi:hypothetical protein